MSRGTTPEEDDCALLAVLLLILLTLLAGCTPMQLRVAFHATTVADVATSERALSEGCVEGNPLIGENAALVGIGLLKSALYEMVYAAASDEPESVRRFFGWVALVLGLIGPVNNVYVMNQGCVQ
jgi:hypothetical protein